MMKRIVEQDSGGSGHQRQHLKQLGHHALLADQWIPGQAALSGTIWS